MNALVFIVGGAGLAYLAYLIGEKSSDGAPASVLLVVLGGAMVLGGIWMLLTGGYDVHSHR